MQSESVNQWLDADQVMSLAEGLLEQNPQGAPISNEKMFGSSFEGFELKSSAASSAVSTVARKSLSDAHSRAASSGIIREAKKVVAPASPVAAEVKHESKSEPKQEPALEQKAEANPVNSEPVKKASSPFSIETSVSPKPTSVPDLAKVVDPSKIAASSGIIGEAKKVVAPASPVAAEVKLESKSEPKQEPALEQKVEANPVNSEPVKKASSPFSIKTSVSPKPTSVPDLAKAVDPSKIVAAAEAVGATKKDPARAIEPTQPDKVSRVSKVSKASEQVRGVVPQRISTPVRVIEAKKSMTRVKAIDEPKAKADPQRVDTAALTKDVKVSPASEKSDEPSPARKSTPEEVSPKSHEVEVRPELETKVETEAPNRNKMFSKPEPSPKVPAQPPLAGRVISSKKPDLPSSPFQVASKPRRVTKPAPPASDAFRPVPLSIRLQAFGDWLKEQIPTRAYFICDRHGEIVVDEVGSEKLVKVARTLAHASSSAGRQVGDDQNLGSLHVKIGPDRVMEVVPRHSHFGLVVLGVIVPRPLSRDAVASVSRALGTALAEPSTSRK